MCEETSGTGGGLSVFLLSAYMIQTLVAYTKAEACSCVFPPSEVQDHSWSREPSVDMPSQH